MNLSRRFALSWGIAALSLALPRAIWHRAQARLHYLNGSLRQQTEELARLTSENERLARHPGATQSTRSLSSTERLELLSLRSEVGRLRQQTNRAAQLRADNQRLQVQPDLTPKPTLLSASEAQEQLKTEAVAALQNVCAVLQDALRRYAAEHSGKLPRDFSELSGQLSTANGFMPGLFSFSFVSDSAPVDPPPDALILQGMSRRNADGQWTKLYARGDGRIVEAISDNGDFEAWERQQKLWPPQTNQTWNIRRSP